MDANEYLLQVAKIEKKITFDLEKLEAAKAALHGRTMSYDRDNYRASSKKNGFESAVIHFIAYEEYINSEINALTMLRLKIEKEISYVPDDTLRELLTRKYLLFQKWARIAEEMEYDVRYIYKLRIKALKAFSEANKDLFSSDKFSISETYALESSQQYVINRGCVSMEQNVDNAVIDEMTKLPQEIIKAIKTMDEVIPPPNNKMVDFEHLSFASAWETIRSYLLISHKGGVIDINRINDV